MKFYLRLTFFLLLLCSAINMYAQVPTVQDCLGALPVCQPIYTTTNSYLGSGNYLNEVGTGSCLSPGDYNSTWMTLTVRQSGNLNFVITPAQPGDYDYAVYNLTNATCPDIKNNPSLLVSCNSAYTPLGPTGTNDTSTLTRQGPGSGMPFNAPIPVKAGETYTINIENWNGFAGGFTIDFGTSTASIFDTIPPALQLMTVKPCDSSLINFTFSEYILCNSIQDADFTLTGPGGPYVLSSVSGIACGAGGAMEKVFTIHVAPAISKNGTYHFNLVGGSGFVDDLCGNVASAGSLTFIYNKPSPFIASSISPTCGIANGSISVGVTGGIPPYTYSMNGGAGQSSNTFSNLGSGIYLFSVKDSGGCILPAIKDTLKANGGTLTATVSGTVPVSCATSCDGSALVSVTGGISPYSFLWSSGDSTAAISGLCAGTYIITVTDVNWCTDTSTAVIAGKPAIVGTKTQQNILCHNGNDGAASLDASGGTGTLTYSWTPSGGNGASASNLTAGNYTVVVTDQNNCTAGFQFTITEPPPLIVTPQPKPDSICNGQNILLNAGATGGTPEYTFDWDNGAHTGPLYIVFPASSTTYTCVAKDANGCLSLPQQFLVVTSPRPVINLGNDTIICLGDTLMLDAYFPNSSFHWKDGSNTATYTVKKEGAYYVAVTNSCATARDSINIIYHDCSTCIHFPGAFSPNNDGHNDFFHGLYDCTILTFHFRIYNRWGQMVYESNNPNTIGWNGNFNGSKCEIGNYVYVVSFSAIQDNVEISDIVKGSVELLR